MYLIKTYRIFNLLRWILLFINSKNSARLQENLKIIITKLLHP